MITELFIFAFVIAVSLLYYGYSKKKLAWLIFAFIMFGALTFQSFAIESMDSSGVFHSRTEPLFLYTSLAFSAVSFILSIVASANMKSEQKQEKEGYI